MARENKVEKVFVHCFMDGRDTPPEQRHRIPPPARTENARIRRRPDRQHQRPLLRDGSRQSLGAHRKSLSRRWFMATRKQNSPIPSPRFARATKKASPTNSSFPPSSPPQAAAGKPAAPRGVIRDDDAVIFFNFRADRARQMTRALAEPGFKEFADPARPKNLAYVGMTQYDKAWPWLRYLLAPGKTRTHPRQRFRRAAIQESARRGNRKIRARHLFLQWRRRKTVRRRRAHRSCLRRKFPPTI